MLTEPSTNDDPARTRVSDRPLRIWQICESYPPKYGGGVGSSRETRSVVYLRALDAAAIADIRALLRARRDQVPGVHVTRPC